MNTIGKFIFSIGLAISSLFGYHQPAQVPLTGSFTPVEGTQWTISVTALPTDTTISLTSFATPNGQPYTMSNFGSIGYATLDPLNSSRLETITFSGITQNTNGTAVLTGVTRGIDFVPPYTASTTLAHLHLVGSTMILSNPAAFYGQQFLFANNISTSTATLIFSSTTPPYYDADPIWANFSTQTLADISYVNSVVAGGAANASETVKGIIQLATALQSASSTSSGSTGARLVIPASLATSTPGTNATLQSVMSLNDAKLSPNWLNGNNESYTFNGLTTTLNASTTNINYNATIASSTQYIENVGVINATSTIKVNGLPVLTSVSVQPNNQYSVASTTTSGNITTGNTYTSTGITVPAGVLTASSTISILVGYSCADAGSGGQCTLTATDESSNTYASYGDTPGTSKTDNAVFNIQFSSNNSTSAQNSITTGTIIGTSASVSVDQSNTATVDWTVAHTFKVKLAAASNGTAVLKQFSIIVRP